MSKTNTGLVEYAVAQIGKPYWYGCFGQKATKDLYKAKKKQYPSEYTWECPTSHLNKKVHDCVGLIKGYLWCDSPTDTTPKYVAAQDVSANGLKEKCTLNGKIDTIPELPGVLVFLPGHVGVYIGNGYVVEARGHAYGVQKTKLKDRGWKTWGKCPYITYVTPKPKQTENTTVVSDKIKHPKYSVGKNYKTQVDELNVRTGAGTSYKIKSYSQLTANAQKNADKKGRLKKGTTITVQEVKTVGKDIWLRIPSGWIAGYYNGKEYVK